MPQYDAEVLMEGWLRIRVAAPSAAAARKLLSSLRPRISFVNEDGIAVGVIEDAPLFTVVIEEVEPFEPKVESPYHAPARERSG